MRRKQPSPKPKNSHLSTIRDKGRIKGFTIIEVLIVLAVISMIFLIVFLAVPALQRTSRNYQRKNDVRLLITRVHEQISTTGTLPASCNTSQHANCFLRDVNLTMYDNKSLSSSSENNVSWWRRTNQTNDPPLDPTNWSEVINKVSVRSWARCDGDRLTGLGAKRHDIAASFVIETYSGYIVTCLDT